MKRSSGPRKTANLSESTNRQLNKYALAAGAAGVGMLTLTPPAEAKIVYTPADTKLRINAYTKLDLNHDGVTDFKFYLHSFSATSFFDVSHTLKVGGVARKNQILSVRSFRYYCAAALPRGKVVGPKRPFRPGYLTMFGFGAEDTGSGYKCPWLSQKVKTQAYLGLKFSLKGKVHYGWARLGNIHSFIGKASATLTGYAYETIPGKSIKAGQTKEADDPTNDFSPGASLTSPFPDTPQPASLGMLARGAQGVPLWRRKESALQGN